MANEVFYDVAMQRLTEQLQRVDALDTKAATVFSFATGVVAFFGALFSLATPPADTAAKTIFWLPSR